MKKTLIFLAFALIVTIKAQSQDVTTIKELTKRFEVVFNQKDAKATANFWSEDGDYINHVGEVLHGRPAIEKYFQTIFSQYYQTAQNKLSEPRIRLLKPDIAAVDVEWKMMGATSSDGKSLPTFSGIMVWTLAKESNKWFIKIMHNLSLPESK